LMGPAAGGKGSGEQSWPQAVPAAEKQDWLVIADRTLYNCEGLWHAVGYRVGPDWAA